MAATSTSTQSIDLVRQFNSEVFNSRDYDRIYDIQTEDYVQHGPLMGMELHGNEESLETMQMFHAAFSDLEATEEFAFASDDGEFVCSHYVYRGTHDGDLMGIPATDAEAETRGTVVNRIEDGKIAEAWILADFLGLFQQVGVIPAMDELAD